MMKVVLVIILNMHKQTDRQTEKHPGGNLLVLLDFFPFCKCMLHTVTELQRRKEKKLKKKKCFCEIPQRLSAATSSVHRWMVHLSTVHLLSGFLWPSPLPLPLSWHTNPPSNFSLQKIKDRKKRKMAMTRGQTASHYHNSGNHITVPLRLIQRSSRRTSHNLQRSNRNITLSNPPTRYTWRQTEIKSL